MQVSFLSPPFRARGVLSQVSGAGAYLVDGYFQRLLALYMRAAFGACSHVDLAEYRHAPAVAAKASDVPVSFALVPHARSGHRRSTGM